MPGAVSISIGVVVAREDVDSKWEDHVWRPVGVLPGSPDIGKWEELKRGDGWVHYYAGTHDLELFRKETDAYKFNLEGREPAIYVILTEPEEGEEGECPFNVHLVTASPYEAADYLDSGDQIIEPVQMPKSLFTLVDDFVQEYHVEQKFKKRVRDEVKLEDHKFGQEPVFEIRKRMRQDS